MKISLQWLNALLETAVSAERAERALMDVGFPVDSRQDLPTGDVVLDVEVTSNRPDCLCHLGVARELAAALGCRPRTPDCDLPAPPADSEPVASIAAVRNEAPDLCPVYTARVIRGVKIGPSPAWMVARLAALGLRSINNVVDVTNYVMFELGQPLHAFDLNRLTQRTIVVRTARAGEPFVAIDSSRHALRAGMLVIADAQRPVAVAGIMGGLESEVGPSTVDVLLEAALFTPLQIRRTSRTLKLASDSSYRFERGIDPVGVELSSRRAAKLMLELAGGRLASGVIRAGVPEPAPLAIELRAQRCRDVLGIDLPADEMVQLLARLNLSPRLEGSRGVIACTAPPYRLDLRKEIDLIEEVGRLAGYDRLHVGERIHVVARSVQPDVAALRQLRQTLTAHGYFETVNFSFVSPAAGQPFVPAGAQPVLIDDERRRHEPMLRPSLLPSLLACRKANQDVGAAAVRLFETAATWLRREGNVAETRRLALLADVEDASPAAAGRGLRDLRGLVAEAAQRLRGAAPRFEPVASPVFVAAAAVVVDDRSLGAIGLLAPPLQQLFGLQTPVLAAELELDALLERYPVRRDVQPLAATPAIERDLSVVVPEATAWRRIEEAVRAAQPALLEELRFVTTYRGNPVPAGHKSVTLRLVFRDPQATLRHEQVDPQVAAVVARLQEQLHAQLRK